MTTVKVRRERRGALTAYDGNAVKKTLWIASNNRRHQRGDQIQVPFPRA